MKEREDGGDLCIGAETERQKIAMTRRVKDGHVLACIDRQMGFDRSTFGTSHEF